MYNLKFDSWSLHGCAGVVTQVNQILCGIPEAKAYCNSQWSAILVSVLPSILLTVWQQVVLPLLFYWYAFLSRHTCTVLKFLQL